MLFIIGHMGFFVYTQKGYIISTVDLPTTEIIEPVLVFFNGDRYEALNFSMPIRPFCLSF
ncbi:hypothetical protein [Streptococcus suis]|uniref:hypothetical protein n=1 Tax=Streptococcus suis TaxID=1307 RepID=UPI0020169DCB